MHHFITDAPAFMVRTIMSLARGWAEDAPADSPLWVEQVIHVHEDDAFAVISALKGYRIEGRKPAKVAIGDPTFAMAAASIERGGGTPSSAAFAR